jgi:hypothetical protein
MRDHFVRTADDQIMVARQFDDAASIGECLKPLGVLSDAGDRQAKQRVHSASKVGISGRARGEFRIRRTIAP